MQAPAPIEGRPGRRRKPALLFGLFLLWPMLLVGTSGPSMVDSTLLASIRLVDDQTWTLSDESDPKTVFLLLAHDISAHDGRVYSGVGPGASIVAAPFYFTLRPLFSLFDDRVIASRRILHYYQRNSEAAGRPLSSHFRELYLLQIALTWCLMAPLYAGFLVRFHGLLLRRGIDPTPAIVTVAAVGLGTMALYYSSAYTRQGLAYLLLWHGILFLFDPRAPGRRACAAAGLLLGSAVAIDYPALLLVVLTLVFLLPGLDRGGRLFVLAPVAGLLALVGLYHDLAFGSALATPYHHRFWFTPAPLAAQGLDLSAFQNGPTLGMNLPSPGVILRLCFGTYKGLFIYSPVLLAGLVGHLTASGKRNGRGVTAFCLLGFVGYLIFNASLGTHVPEYGKYFWGGLSVLWGPRYLFGVLPLVAFGLTRLDWSRAPVRIVVYGALAVSCLSNLLGAMYSHIVMATPAFGPELRSPLPYVYGLLFTRGPRLPILDGYGIQPIVQSMVLLIAVALSLYTWRLYLRDAP